MVWSRVDGGGWRQRLAEAADYETGQLGRLARGATWLVPTEVYLDGDRLVWGFAASQQAHAASGAERLLDDFCKLADAEDAEIMRYAKRWGGLWLCEHDEPFVHRQADETSLGCVPRHEGALYWEPLSTWRAYARHVRALISIASAISRGEVGRDADWQEIPNRLALLQVAYATTLGISTVLKPDQLRAAAEWESSPLAQQKLLTGAVAEWLERGQVRPSLEWNGEAPSIGFAGFGLIGGVAVQLLFAACQARRSAVCSGCHQPKPVPPDRMGPRGKQRWFCDDCGGTLAARKVADRDRRARARLEKLRPRADSNG